MRTVKIRYWMYLGLALAFFYNFGCVPKTAFSTDYLKYSALKTKQDSCKVGSLPPVFCQPIFEEIEELRIKVPDFPEPCDRGNCFPTDLRTWLIYPGQQVIISDFVTRNPLIKLEASNKPVRDGLYLPKITLGKLSIPKNQELEVKLLDGGKSYINTVNLKK